MADLSIIQGTPNPNMYTAVQQGIADSLANSGAVQQQATAAQNQQVQAFALQKAQQDQAAQQAQQQAYNQGVSQFIAAPSQQGATNLQLKFPDQAKAIKDVWAQNSEQQQTSDRQSLATVYSALDGGHNDIAQKVLEDKIAGDAAAGRPNANTIALLQTVKTDPSHAKGMAAYVLSSIPGGEDFAKTLAAVQPDGAEFKGQVVGRGIGHYDENHHWVLDYRDPDAAQFKTVANGDGSTSIVQVGGGGQASGGGGQTFKGGWTPVSTNGRANVDAKLASASQILGGVGLDDDVSHLGAAQVAKAMTANENVDPKYNNPAAIMDPATGKLRQYPNPQAGINAAASLVARKLAGGQTTLRTLIEGKPTNAAPASGGANPVYTSKPSSLGEDPATIDFYAQKVAAGGDLPQLGMGKQAASLRQAILARSAQIQMNNGVSGGDSNLQHADVKTATTALAGLQKTRNSLNPFLQTFDGASAQVRALAPKGVAGGVPVFNRWVQAGRQGITGDADLTRFNVAIQAVANENAKIMSGASGGAVSSDSARHEAQSLINNAQTLDGLMAALDQMHTDTQIRVKSLDDRQAELRNVIAGRKPQTPAQAAPQAAPAQQNSPVHITTRAQAMALAPGTKFIEPSGQVRTRP